MSQETEENVPNDVVHVKLAIIKASGGTYTTIPGPNTTTIIATYPDTPTAVNTTTNAPK